MFACAYRCHVMTRGDAYCYDFGYKITSKNSNTEILDAYFVIF